MEKTQERPTLKPLNANHFMDIQQQSSKSSVPQSNGNYKDHNKNKKILNRIAFLLYKSLKAMRKHSIKKLSLQTVIKQYLNLKIKDDAQLLEQCDFYFSELLRLKYLVPINDNETVYKISMETEFILSSMKK